MERLSVEDLLLIAEVVIEVPGERLARAARLDAMHAALAASGSQPVLADAAAVLCHRLVRDRPLPLGNKPVALLAMLELVSRNHGVWTSPSGGGLEVAATVERLAAGRLSEADFVAWARARVRAGAGSGRG